MCVFCDRQWSDHLRLSNNNTKTTHPSNKTTHPFKQNKTKQTTHTHAASRPTSPAARAPSASSPTSPPPSAPPPSRSAPRTRAPPPWSSPSGCCATSTGGRSPRNSPRSSRPWRPTESARRASRRRWSTSTRGRRPTRSPSCTGWWRGRSRRRGGTRGGASWSSRRARRRCGAGACGAGVLLVLVVVGSTHVLCCVGLFGAPPFFFCRSPL